MGRFPQSWCSNVRFADITPKLHLANSPYHSLWFVLSYPKWGEGGADYPLIGYPLCPLARLVQLVDVVKLCLFHQWLTRLWVTLNLTVLVQHVIFALFAWHCHTSVVAANPFKLFLSTHSCVVFRLLFTLFLSCGAKVRNLFGMTKFS